MDNLVRNLNEGDKTAFKKLFNKFFHSSCAFVNKYIAEKGAVEDVVQDTFINLWDKRKIFSGGLHFKSYLYKSLRNNSLYYLRQNKSNEEIPVDIKEENTDFLKSIIEEEISREITEAINNLPEQRKKIIELSLQGFKNEEISEELQISINTVKTQKRKAYAQLRENLENVFILYFYLKTL